MTFSTNLYKVVKTMMAATGKTATLIQEPKGDEGTYDPATGTYTVGAATSTTVKVILHDYKLASSGLQTQFGTIIEAGDKQCYMDAKDSGGNDIARKPSPTTDSIIVDGVTWAVAAVQEYNPSGTYTIMYDIQLKR